MNCIALRALEAAVDPAEQRVGLAHAFGELLNRHEERQQHHAAGVLNARQLAGDGVRQLLHRPRLASPGVGADEHSLRLVRALRPLR